MGYAGVRAGLLRRETSKQIQRTTMLFLGPPVAFLSMWSLRIYGIDILGVPLAGAAVCVAGLGIGYLAARWLRLERLSAGAFIAASGWSNTFLLGGYLAFILFGNQGLALTSLYNVPNMPVFYIVGFSVAGAFGSGRQTITARQAFKDFITDPVSVLPNVGMLAGLAVNLAGSRPGNWIGAVNTYAMPVFTIITMFAVGMTMTWRVRREHWRPIVVQGFIKYALWPAITFAVILLVGGNVRHDPVTFRVLMLLACMPVAMQALMLSNLFGLDMELVNAMWLVSTLFSLATSPLLIYALRV
jgi:predicted permease